MKAEALLAHYARIAEAPDAIARLRRFVVDLAMRGKLLPQDPGDEPASVLVASIARTKTSLIQSGELRRDKPLPPITTSDISFDLPSGWAWVRLGNISLMVTSGSRDWAQHYADEGAIFVRMGNLSKGHYRLRLEQIQRVKPPAGGEGTRTRLEAGDVLISITGDVGMLGLIPEGFGDAYINQHTAMVRPMPTMKGRYLPELFCSPFAQNQFNAPQRGIKNSFRLTDVTEFVVPLPPLAEQRRIVAKLDELMALCDRLEVARTAREVTRDRLAAASLARLNTPDPQTFPADARFALNALPALTTRPNQIQQLRQTILNLAVRGKLVPQDARDGEWANGADPALSVDGRLAMALPPGWRWIGVVDVASARLGKMLDAARNQGTPVPYLGNTNVHWFDVRTSDLKTIPLSAEEIEEYRLRAGDVLICEGGHGIARAAVWRGGDDVVVFQKALHRVRPNAELDPDYFTYCCFVYFDNGVMQTYFTGVGIPHFTGRALAKLVFPLPPLAEQHRIVAKVNALMALCDQLEASLTAASTTRAQLLEATLREALLPAEEILLEAAQ